MKKLALLFVIGFIWNTEIVAQISRAPKAVPLKSVPDDSVSTKQDSTRKAEDIRPWKHSEDYGSREITNDSLLRWQIWPNWGDFYAYREGVVSFRQGTVGRVDGFVINGYTPYEQQLSVNGMSMNNPITGLINYNFVPHHKIGVAKEAMLGDLYSSIRLKDYYILQPISYLNYDEADYNYRNLEFMVTQNFRERTNLEISYWDRRDGDNYPNNQVQGSQIFGKLYHYLNQNMQIRATIIRNEFKNKEPFGYVVTNPVTFSFSEYSSQPNSSNGISRTKQRNFITGIYHRPDDAASEDFGFEFILSKYKNNLRFTQDTLKWDVSGIGGKAFKTLEFGIFDFKTEAEITHYGVKDSASVTKDGWDIMKLSTRLNLAPFRKTELSVFGHLSARSDDKSGFEVGTNTFFSLSKNLNINAGVAAFNRIPTIQSLYWKSRNYTGNNTLKNEKGISVFGDINMNILRLIEVGGRFRYKLSENGTFLSADSSFVNGGKYGAFSATVYGNLSSGIWEMENSATVTHFDDSDLNPGSKTFNKPGSAFVIRNALFVKGYAFDRATFIKTGVRTLFSPSPFGSYYYNTELGFWQANSAEISIPAYFRMDVELSARIRRIMVVLRWENVLDDIGQSGYFETATYPMSGRRLIVGIRAKFIN